MELKDILHMAKIKNASDAHFTVGQPPIFRIHGFLKRTEYAPLTTAQLEAYVGTILSDERKKWLDHKGEVDLALELKGECRLRVNVFKERKGYAIACRIIPDQIKTIEELGLPAILNTVVLMEKGLILVTGPTGSGKSTSLAAMIDKINRDCAKHIITIEDPIEFIHEHKNCMVHQREVNMHTGNFKDALRSTFREDPNVILIGEMRDLETISMAITAAETGHVVFATLHTIGAPQTINRIIDAFPTDQQEQIRIQLTEVLELVVSQILVPTKNLDGRVVATEVMFCNPAIKNLIREGKTHQIPTVVQTSLSAGMHDMGYSLKMLYEQNKISEDEYVKKIGVLMGKK